MKESNYLGMIFIMFIAAIVGLTFLGSVADLITSETQTATITNQSFVFPANQSTITLTGQAAYNVIVRNQSGYLYGSTNYTVTNYVNVTSGTPSVTLKGLSTTLNGSDVYVSYAYEPVGYITDTSARTIAGLVILFFVIAIVISVLVPSFREKILEKVGF